MWFIHWTQSLLNKIRSSFVVSRFSNKITHTAAYNMVPTTLDTRKKLTANTMMTATATGVEVEVFLSFFAFLSSLAAQSHSRENNGRNTYTNENEWKNKVSSQIRCGNVQRTATNIVFVQNVIYPILCARVHLVEKVLVLLRFANARPSLPSWQLSICVFAPSLFRLVFSSVSTLHPAFSE